MSKQMEGPARNQVNEGHGLQQQGEDEEAERGSSLSKTIGNVLSLVNDGLYRIKNRSKAE